jgi:hypothetical protein
VRAVVIGAAPAAAATGCATVHGLSKDLHELTTPAASSAATNLACTWQNRVTNLPDPLRNGAPTPGVAGQIFLFDAKYQSAEATGELTVVVSDVSPRPPGVVGPTPEAWHFTNATLKNLRYVDERIGRCYIIFLPWPSTWKDVTRVRFQVRYDQPNGPTLFAQEALVTLDFSPGPDGALPGSGGGGSVPNPAEVLKQARAAQASGRSIPPNYMTPPTGTQPVSSPPAGTQSPANPPSGMPPPSYPPAGAWGPPMGTPQVQPYPPGYANPQVPTYPPGNTNPQVPTYPAGYYGPPPGYGAMPAGAMAPPQSAAGGVQPGIVPFRPPGMELAVPGPPEIRIKP